MDGSKHSVVLELSLKCPFLTAQRNCPLERFRHISLERRIAMLESMLEVQLDGIIDYHNECVNVRSLLTF